MAPSDNFESIQDSRRRIVSIWSSSDVEETSIIDSKSIFRDLKELCSCKQLHPLSLSASQQSQMTIKNFGIRLWLRTFAPVFEERTGMTEKLQEVIFL